MYLFLNLQTSQTSLDKSLILCK